MTEVKQEIEQQFGIIEKLWDARQAKLLAEIEALRVLKTHDLAAITLRLDDVKQQIATALTVVHETNRSTEIILEKRFQAVADTQNAMSEQAMQFASRAEGEVAHDAFRREIDELRIKVTRAETHYETSEKTATLERAQLDQRLASMNEFRAQLTEQAQTFMTRTEFDASHKPLTDKIIQLSTPNYAVYGSFASLVVGLVAAMWLVIGLKIESTNTPTVLTVEQVKITQGVLQHQIDELNHDVKWLQNENTGLQLTRSESQKDRAQLNDRLHATEIAIDTGKTERLTTFAQMKLELSQLRDELLNHLSGFKNK